MGREIKRVTTDFDWPIGKVWEGFLNPHYVECPDCHNRPTEIQNHLTWWVMDLINSRLRKCPELGELTEALCGRSGLSPFGHDAIDRWQATNKILDVAGLPHDWGCCPTCNGEGIDPQHQEAYEAWEPSEPPEGDGWQVWENTSEGSPISPVFVNRENLVSWLVVNEQCTESAANAFIDRGYAFSFVAIPGKGWQTGIQTSDE